MRDFQKQKVYDWENSIITVPTRQIAFSQAQTLVDGLWLAEGLLYPPKVVPKPKQKTTAWAAGDRSTIELPETIPEWVLLHELAHALSMHSSGHGDGHGPIWELHQAARNLLAYSSFVSDCVGHCIGPSIQTRCATYL